jgi:hypothetical protein
MREGFRHQTIALRIGRTETREDGNRGNYFFCVCRIKPSYVHHQSPSLQVPSRTCSLWPAD